MDEISAISSVTSGKHLTPDQQAQVERLAKRDRDVRAHEAAHLAAAGVLAGGVDYTYQLGPDGKLYAVGGKVRIVIPPSSTPEEALAEARQLLAAADAPTDPSNQDMSVAAKAGQMERQAQQEIAKEHAQSAHQTSGSHPKIPAHTLDRMV